MLPSSSTLALLSTQLSTQGRYLCSPAPAPIPAPDLTLVLVLTSNPTSAMIPSLTCLNLSPSINPNLNLNSRDPGCSLTQNPSSTAPPAGVHLLDAQFPIKHAEPTGAGQGADHSGDLPGHIARCEDHVHHPISALDTQPGGDSRELPSGP